MADPPRGPGIAPSESGNGTADGRMARLAVRVVAGAKTFGPWLLHSLSVLVAWLLTLIKWAWRWLSANGVPGDWFVIAAGADAGWFRRNDGAEEERRRFRTQGMIVCLTAVFATLGALYFFTFVFRNETGEILGLDGGSLAVAFALVWGAMIFSLDRLMLQTMLGEQGRRAGPATIRIILAVVIGIVIAHPLKLLIFKDDLDREYNLQRQDWFKAQAQRSQEASQRAHDGLFVGLRSSRDDLEKYIDLSAFVIKAEILGTRYRSAKEEEQTNDKKTDSSRDVAIELPTSSRSVTVRLTQIEGGCGDWNRGQLGSINNLYEVISGSYEEGFPTPWDPPTDDLSSRSRDLLTNLTRKMKFSSVKDDDAAITNCNTFQWLEIIWGDARTKALEAQRILGVTDAERSLLQARFEIWSAASGAASTDRKCVAPMQGYTLKDQQRQEKSLNASVPLDDYRRTIFEGDGEAEADAPEVKAQKREASAWAAYICAQRYPDNSFIRQTELLHLYSRPWSEPDEEALKFQSARIHNPWVILVASWALTLIFAFVETIPILSKLFSRPGKYELDVARRLSIARRDFAKGAQKSPEEISKDNRDEALARLDEKLALQSAEAALAMRSRMFQKKAEILLSDKDESAKQQEIAFLDREFEKFVQRLDPKVREKIMTGNGEPPGAEPA